MKSKRQIIELLRHLKERYDLSGRSWANLLGIPQDAYNNALYKNYLSDDNYLIVVKSLSNMVNDKFIVFDLEELRILA